MKRVKINICVPPIPQRPFNLRPPFHAEQQQQRKKLLGRCLGKALEEMIGDAPGSASWEVIVGKLLVCVSVRLVLGVCWAVCLPVCLPLLLLLLVRGRLVVDAADCV